MIDPFDSTPIHHVIFAQCRAARRGGEIVIPGYWNGNLAPWGELVPGTVVALPEDASVPADLAAPLSPSLTPVLLSGFSRHDLVGRTAAYFRARTAIRRLVWRARFVQIQHVSTLGFMAGRVAARLGRPFYLDMGGSLRDPPGQVTPRPWRHRMARRFFLERAERTLARHARLLVAVNEHLFDMFPPSQAPKVVAPQTLIQPEDIVVRDTACTGLEAVVLVATRLIESKGIQHLIAAVARLRASGMPVRLQIAGSGDYEARLKELAAEASLGEMVSFLGGLPPGEGLWRLYRAADLVVLPSLGHYEGTPRMIIEAWAAGAPVVATKVGGIPKMVQDEVNGLLVAPADEAGLAHAIERVRRDRELCRRLVSNGYETVQGMTYRARLPILREALQRYMPGLLPEGE